MTGHYELDYTNHQDTRGFTKTAETIHNAMAATGLPWTACIRRSTRT